MSDLPKMSTWGTQGQKYEICDKAARERNTELGRETESIRSEVEALKQMSATAEELPSGSKPTASYSNGVLHLGIPQGPKGDTGDTGPQGQAGEAGVTPNITVTAVTGEPGTDVQVEQIGTVENPVLKFTIPRGNDGYVGADGAPGANGQGVPTGGTTGQVLRKTGSGDYEAEWSDKAGDSERLGGLNAQYYAQGRAVHNLLDNSDFRNPVNQRGASSYSGNVYTIDRWRLNANTLNVGSDGITLVTGDSSSAVLTQYISGLRDGVYTQALNVNGTIYTRIIQLSGPTITTIDSSNTAYTGGYVSSVVSSSGYFSFQIRANAGYSITVRWAALYEGSYDANTLPAYQPKGYAAELAECQRYYQEISEQTSCAFATSAQGGKYFSSSITFNPMRITPTVSFKTDSDGKIGVVQGVAFVSPSEFNFAYIKNGCLLPATTNAAYAGLVMSFYGIQLSADL